MFADQIIDSTIFDCCEEKAGKDLRYVLEKSNKFRLEDRTVFAAQRISDRKPSNIVGCLPFARLPFKHTWIEYSVQNSDPLKEVVTKCGLLYCGFDDKLNSGTIILFFKCIPNKKLALNLHSLAFDWSGHRGLRAHQANYHDQSALSFALDIGSNSAKDWPDPKEAEAATHLSCDIYGMEMNELSDKGQWFEPFHRGVNKAGEVLVDKDKFLKALNFSIDVANAQMPMSLACILLINCRAGVAIEAADLSRLNTKRLARKARPLYEHKTVTLDIFKQRPASDRQGRPGRARDDLRAHMVMGHFKKRKTGVFWWSPHVRGDASIGWIDKDYEVV